MIYLLKLESIIYKILSADLKCKIFNNVPDTEFPPYVRIGEIEIKDWLLTPKSNIVKITISAFSEMSSNIEVIELISKIKSVLDEGLTNSKYKFIFGCDVIQSDIYQLGNKTWVGEISIEIQIIKEI